MIRHPYDSTEVEAAIAAVDSGWKKKAAARIRKFVDLGRYEEASAIWSVVKPVYMRLQHNKCVFCEQQLEGGLYGPVAWDLEHFRPKGELALWPDPVRHADLVYGQGLGAASATGYYWLAYELRNYAASCKVCNTRFKLNYFPVGAGRGAVADPVDALLHSEQPLLCYPLGDLDEDPEDLVTFMLTTAVPKQKTGPGALRGQVIIDFFGLNLRDHIHRDRARMIGAAGSLLLERDRGTASPAQLRALALLQERHVPHAGCIRAFLKLWEDDVAQAFRGYEACLLHGFDPSAAPPSL